MQNQQGGLRQNWFHDTCDETQCSHTEQQAWGCPEWAHNPPRNSYLPVEMQSISIFESPSTKCLKLLKWMKSSHLCNKNSDCANRPTSRYIYHAVGINNSRTQCSYTIFNWSIKVELYLMQIKRSPINMRSWTDLRFMQRLGVLHLRCLARVPPFYLTFLIGRCGWILNSCMNNFV